MATEKDTTPKDKNKEQNNNIVCVHCHAQKKYKYFHKDSSRKSGIHPWCKKCVSSCKKAHWLLNKQRITQQRSLKLESNKEKKKIYNKNYGQVNAKRISIGKKKYRKNNPEKIRSKNQRREANLRGAVVEKFLDVEIFERDRWVCQLCFGKINKYLKKPDPLSASLDHVIPISKGGSHARKNVVLAHLGCNVAKGNRAAQQQQRLF